MAGGWTRDGAVQEQIDDSVTDAVLRARALMPQGDSAEDCDDCGEPIPRKRREAVPGVALRCLSVGARPGVHTRSSTAEKQDSQ